MQTSLIELAGSKIVVTGGRGPRGEKGETGLPSSATSSYTAGDAGTIVNTVVALVDGVLVAAQPTVEMARKVVGVATQSAVAGDSVEVLLNGPRQDSAWSWAEESLLFLGADGALTTIPPTTGALLLVGKTTGPDSIIVSISTPISLG